MGKYTPTIYIYLYGIKKNSQKSGELQLYVQSIRKAVSWNVRIIEVSNYRGISLLNVTYKIFTNILSKHLKVYTDEIIGEYQGGFRKGLSTTDHIFTLRQILEKAHEYNISLHQLYIDFKQAFDSIDRIQIIEIMKEFGIPLKLVKLTKMTIQNI
jgi:hypothetical protein